MGNLTAICVSSPLYIYVLGQHSISINYAAAIIKCVCVAYLFSGSMMEASRLSLPVSSNSEADDLRLCEK